MRGHVTRKGNRWYFVLDVGVDEITGKRKQRWFSGFKSKPEAETAMIEKIHELNKGIYVEPTNLTLGEYLIQWLEMYAKVNCAPRTYSGYSYIVNTHVVPSIGKVLLDKLKPSLIQQYYSQKLLNGRIDGKGGLSVRSIHHQHRLLHEALEHAVRLQILSVNPVKAVIKPKPQKKHFNVLDKDELHLLLKLAKETNIYGPVYLAINTGMRRGEIMGLSWRNVDFENSMLSIHQTLQRLKGQGLVFRKTTKNDGSRRTIALTDTVISYLKKLKAIQEKERSLLGSQYNKNDLIFVNSIGNPFDPDKVTRGFTALIKKLELPHVRFHDLRHTHATLLLQQKVHPKIVSERLGHSTITITMDTYSHVLPNMQKEAAQQLDDFLFGKDTL